MIYIQRYIYLTVFLFLPSFAPAFSQADPDSLIANLDKASGKKKLDLYIEVTKILSNTLPAKGEALGNEGLILADKLNDKISKVKLLSNIALCQRVMGKYQTALQNYLDALDTGNEVGDETLIAEIKNSIGNVYNYIGNLDKAIEYYRSALSIRIKLKDSLGIARSYNNIGNVYKVKMVNDTALEYLEKSLLLKQKLGDRNDMVASLKNLGSVYMNLGQYETALNYYESAANIELSVGNSAGFAHTQLLSGEVYVKTKELSKAMLNLSSSLNFFQRTNTPHYVMRCYQLLAEVYKLEKDFEKACLYSELYSNIRDSVYTYDLNRQILEMDAIYENHAKEQEIKKLELNEQLMLRNVFIGISVFILFVTIMLIFRYKEKAGLAKEMARTNMDLKLANEKAELANKLKSDFLTQMSHEIRTPINTILNYTSLLKNEFEDKLPEELEGCFDSINTGSTRLIRTIDLILNMSDIESGTYKSHFAKLNLLTQILNPLYLEFSSKAKNKNLELSLSCELNDTEIVADEYSVTQLFVNLLDNAIKYTEKGSVQININEENGNRVVEIIDTGIGISEEYFPYLFTKFSQEEQGYTRRFEGTGLGLSLVKKYCEINNSEIKVDSQKGIGTKFSIIFSNENIPVKRTTKG